MKAKKVKPAPQPAKGKTADLDVRYGKIGISAVAAAMHYHRPAGNKPEQRDRRRGDASDSRDRGLTPVLAVLRRAGRR